MLRLVFIITLFAYTDVWSCVCVVPQMVILDIPDSGAYYVYDGDNIDAEMIRTFIGEGLPHAFFVLALLSCLFRQQAIKP